MSSKPSTESPAPLKICCMMEEVQISDIMGVDVIGNLSADYARTAAKMFPQFEPFVQMASEMKFYFPAVSADELMTVTPGIKVKPNVSFDDCPRDVDVLLIGGPLPSYRPEAALRYMREAFPQAKCVLTTCVGSMLLADAGVLKGKKVTTNRGALPWAKQSHPEIEWLDQRWVIEDGGKLWTSGGAGAGQCSSIDQILEFFWSNHDALTNSYSAQVLI